MFPSVARKKYVFPVSNHEEKNELSVSERSEEKFFLPLFERREENFSLPLFERSEENCFLPLFERSKEKFFDMEHCSPLRIWDKTSYRNENLGGSSPLQKFWGDKSPPSPRDLRHCIGLANSSYVGLTDNSYNRYTNNIRMQAVIPIG